MDREHKAAIIAVMIPTLIMAYSAYHVYLSHEEHNVTFTVFDVWCFKQDGRSVTQVLTWGDSMYGKYYFIGNWTSQFSLDHEYNVTWVQEHGSHGHPWSNLIVIDWGEVM